LDNAALEDLAADLYDEIDRRETDAMWLTNQQLESLVAFLPVNPLFSPLRNQARQKLAMLDKGQFSQILVDVLNECLYRQKRSMETGDCDNGRPIPSGSSDAEMMAPSHDYDEVPLEEMEMEESEETPSESKDKSKEEQSTDGSAKRASKEAEEETEALKQKLKKTEVVYEWVWLGRVL
jgi:G protein-coupled receptor kinase interacting protein 2